MQHLTMQDYIYQQLRYNQRSLLRALYTLLTIALLLILLVVIMYKRTPPATEVWDCKHFGEHDQAVCGYWPILHQEEARENGLQCFYFEDFSYACWPPERIEQEENPGG